MNRNVLVALWLALIPGCVSLSYHQRQLDRVKDEDFEYAYGLAKQVKLRKISASNMRSLLRARYDRQEDTKADPD